MSAGAGRGMPRGALVRPRRAARPAGSDLAARAPVGDPAAAALLGRRCCGSAGRARRRGPRPGARPGSRPPCREVGERVLARWRCRGAWSPRGGSRPATGRAGGSPWSTAVDTSRSGAQPGVVEDLVGVEVAEPDDERLVHQQRLELVVAPVHQRLGERGPRHGRRHRVEARGRPARAPRRPAASGVDHEHLADAVGVDAAQLAALGEETTSCGVLRRPRPWARPAAGGRVIAEVERRAARRCRA